MNIFFPLLHRPSFDKCIINKLHLREDGFASVLLLVCAIGSRFSDDTYTSHPSTGWELFHQVRRLGRRFIPRSIHDMHVYCVRYFSLFEAVSLDKLHQLAALFLESSSTPQIAWMLIGAGLRFAQEVGAHRRAMYDSKPTVNSELWTRAFW